MELQQHFARYPWFLITSAWLALLAGCGGNDGAATGWTGTVDTLASGTIVVHNPRAPLWDSTTAWRLVEDVRIGSVEGDGPDVFGAVSDVTEDAAGRIYVLDQQVQAIRVFAGDGAFIRTVGRSGSGPGEFKTASAMRWDPDGHLWVVDPGNARYAVFDTSGAYLTQYHRGMGGAAVPWPGGIDDEGRLYDFDFKMIPNGGLRRVLIQTERRGDELVPTDTIPVPKPPEDEENFELRDKNSFVQVSIPFASSFTWRFDPHGYLWFASTGEYRIFQRDLTGDTVRIIERAYDPVRVTATERASAIQHLDWFVRQGGKVDASRIPSVKPAFSNFFVDDAGDLWVHVRVAGDAEEGGERKPAPVYDVFGSEGRYLGRVTTDSPTLVFHGDHVLGVVRNELGVQFVVRYHIQRDAGTG